MNLKQKKREVERLYELCGEFDLGLTVEVPESNERADELIAELNEKLAPHVKPKSDDEVAIAVEKAVAKEREASQKRMDELDAKLSQFMLAQSTQTQAQVQNGGGITPDMLKAIEQQGNEPSGVSGAEFAAIVKSDYERWGEVIRSAKIKLD